MLVHLGLSPALNFWVSIYTPGYREARVIPENIHTIPQAASWNSEGEDRFLGLEFQRHGEGLCSLEFQRHGRVSALNSMNFQREHGERFA